MNDHDFEWFERQFHHQPQKETSPKDVLAILGVGLLLVGFWSLVLWIIVLVIR